jgi:hypothetical protein
MTTFSVSRDTVIDTIQITAGATSNNQTCYLDHFEQTWQVIMPLLGTMKINVQTQFNGLFGVLCPFYKQGMPLGLSCSNPHVVCSALTTVPFASAPCDGAFGIAVDTSSELIIFPVTLVLTVSA